MHIYALNSGALKYFWQMLTGLKKKMDNNKVIVKIFLLYSQ